MRDVRHAADDVDLLMLGERRAGELRDDLTRAAGAADEGVAVPAGEAAQRDDFSELTPFDPARAPQIAEGVCFELLEQNERPELFVRPVLRSHVSSRPRGNFADCEDGENSTEPTEG